MTNTSPASIVATVLRNGVPILLSGDPLSGGPRHSEMHTAMNTICGVPYEVPFVADLGHPMNHLQIRSALLLLAADAGVQLPPAPPIPDEGTDWTWPVSWKGHGELHGWEMQAISLILRGGRE